MKKPTKSEISAVMRELGKRGGKMRLKNSSPSERSEWARLGGLKIAGKPRNRKKGKP